MARRKRKGRLRTQIDRITGKTKRSTLPVITGAEAIRRKGKIYPIQRKKKKAVKSKRKKKKAKKN